MKPLTEKQIKAAWIIALVLVVIHFAPTVIHAAMQAFTANKHAAPLPQKPSPMIPAVAPAPATNPLALSPEIQAKFLGNWEGSQFMPNNDQCKVHLELRLSPDAPGHVAGYETRDMHQHPGVRGKQAQRRNRRGLQGL